MLGGKNMEKRILGRTGIEVNAVGMGMEHVVKVSQEEMTAIVDAALEGGVNYFDFLPAEPEPRERFGVAIKGRRDQLVIAGHLGFAVMNGQSGVTRDMALVEPTFDDLLTRFGTDYIDIGMLSFCDTEEDFQQLTRPGGVLDYACRLKKEGKVRVLGMSSHRINVAREAVKSGIVDVMMLPINAAFDVLPGDTILEELWDKAATHEQAGLQEKAAVERKEFYHMCAKEGVALVSMKAYAAGWLFNLGNPAVPFMSPVQCLHYALSQPGVAAVVPGVRNVEEVRAAVHYYHATAEEKDYAGALNTSRWNLREVCMYCNHCLPCPSSINIGETIRLIDTAKYGVTPELKSQYSALQSTTQNCIECGSCMELCPFGVDVVNRLKEGALLFE